jgi:hypothetical protein
MKIGIVKLSADGEPAHAESELRRKLSKRRVRVRTAGQGVGNEPNAMPEIGLPARNIEHMPKKTANRRAQDVQDFQRSDRRRDVIPAGRAGRHGFAAGCRFHLDGGPPVGHRTVP